MILAGWAGYGRHAAPTSDAYAGRSLPALARRGESTVAADRSDADADADADAPGAGADLSAVPSSSGATARAGGILHRCLSSWRTQRAAG